MNVGGSAMIRGRTTRPGTMEGPRGGLRQVSGTARLQPAARAALLLLLLALLAPWTAGAGELVEGRDYRRIVPAQPTDAPPGQVEVVELFWYGCPHCHRFEPYLERWLAHKPEGVHFRRMPATFNRLWILHARAYYTAQALGVLERIHRPLFEAIHVLKRRLDSKERLRAFFAEHGVRPEDFDAVWGSFAVEARVRRAEEMTRRYRVHGTPSLVIDGRYIVDGDNAGGDFNRMLEIAQELIRRERARLRGS
ncbi:MAG: thiol:disulfide interchange protein DsbA/DsbL [Gammaproteobacteria bacterium]|nr:MAG: thiol:disulfide interchange protein DsbA/DsbL [Gammaproteobacteria bacterium]